MRTIANLSNGDVKESMLDIAAISVEHRSQLMVEPVKVCKLISTRYLSDGDIARVCDLEQKIILKQT